MGRLRCIFLCVSGLMCFTGAQAYAAPLACDVNESGAVDAVDVQLVINAALGLPVPHNTNVDHGANGATNAIDVQLVINAVLGIAVDSDLDGLPDAAETNLGTNPNLLDTDGGGVGDGQELVDGTDPLDPSDDRDGGPAEVRWISNQNGNWDDPSNWSAGRVPLVNERAVVDVPGSITVTVDKNTTIGLLDMSERLLVTGSNVQLTVVGDAHVTGGLSLAGGAWLLVNGIGARFTASGPMSIDNHTIRAQGGGVVTLSSLTAYSWTQAASPTLFDAQGAGSRIDLPNLATLTFDVGVNAGYVARINATSQGQVVMPKLQTTLLGSSHRLEINVAGAGSFSAATLPSVASMTLLVGAGTNLTLPAATNINNASATVDGTLTLGALTSATAFTLNLRNAGTFVAGSLQGMTGSAVSLTHTASATLGALTSLQSTSVSVEGNGTLALPALTQWTSNTTTTLLRVLEAGSFSAPALETMSNVAVLVRSGGKLTLPDLATYTWNVAASPTLFDAANTGSELNLPSLTSLTFDVGINAGYVALITAATQAHIDLPVLSTVTLGSSHRLELRLGSAGTMDLAALPSGSGITFTLGPGTSLALPSATALNNSSMVLDGALALPNVTSIGGSTIGIREAASFTAANLTSINTSSISVEDTASLSLPGVTSLQTCSVTVKENGTLSLPALTQWASNTTNTSLSVSDNGAFSAPGLTSMSNVALVVRAGAKVTLPELANYAWTLAASPTIMDAANAGSQLNLPKLKSIVFDVGINAGYQALVTAASSGHIDLPAWDSLTIGNSHRMELRLASSGTFDLAKLASASALILTANIGTNLAMPALTSLNNSTATVNGTLTLPALTATNGTTFSFAGNGAAAMGALAAMTGGSVTVDGTSTIALAGLTTLQSTSIVVKGSGALNLPALTNWTSTVTTTSLAVSDSGVFTAANLASVSNVAMQIRSGAKVTLPALASYSWTLAASPAIMDAANNGSELNLPNLASLTFDVGVNAGYVALITAASSGHIDVPALTTITLGPSHRLEFRLASSGTIDAGALPNGSNITLAVGPGTSLTLPSTTSLTGANFTLDGNLSLPGLTQLTGSTLNFRASSTLTAPNLATINTSTIVVEDTSVVSLPGVTGMQGTSVTVRESGSLTLAGLTGWTSTVTNTFLSVSDGTAVFSAANLASMTNVSLQVRAGAKVTLPALAVYQWNVAASPTILDAANPGSELNLPALTTFSFNVGVNAGYVARFTAASGAQIDVSDLASVTLGTSHSMIVTADGNNSEVDVSSLSPLPAGVTLNAVNGGTIVTPPKYALLTTRDAFTLGDAPVTQAQADLDGDGAADTVTAYAETGEVGVRLGSSGDAGEEVRFRVGEWPLSVAVGDFDGDGFLDIAVGNYLTSDVSLLSGRGDGSFGEESRIEAEWDLYDLNVP